MPRPSSLSMRSMPLPQSVSMHKPVQTAVRRSVRQSDWCRSRCRLRCAVGAAARSAAQGMKTEGAKAQRSKGPKEHRNKDRSIYVIQGLDPGVQKLHMGLHNIPREPQDQIRAQTKDSQKQIKSQKLRITMADFEFTQCCSMAFPET